MKLFPSPSFSSLTGIVLSTALALSGPTQAQPPFRYPSRYQFVSPLELNLDQDQYNGHGNQYSGHETRISPPTQNPTQNPTPNYNLPPQGTFHSSPYPPQYPPYNPANPPFIRPPRKDNDVAGYWLLALGGGAALFVLMGYALDEPCPPGFDDPNDSRCSKNITPAGWTVIGLGGVAAIAGISNLVD